MSDGGFETRRLGTLVRLVTTKAAGADFKVGLEHVEGWTGRLIDSDAEFEGEGVVFEAGDVLFGKLRPYLAKVWVADRPGAAVGDFLVLRPRPQVSSRFLARSLLRREYIDVVSSAVFGSKMPRVSWEILRDTSVPFASHAIEESIADYLDRETAEIDAFIADQQEMVTLLTERAVAGEQELLRSAQSLEVGSPSSSALKMKLGSACLFIRTGPFGSSLHADDYVVGGVPVINPTHIASAGLLPARDVSVDDNTAKRLASWRLHAGDVVVARRGDLGRSAVVSPVEEGYLCGTGSAMIRVRPDRLLPEYLSLAFGAHQNRHELRLLSIGSTMSNVSASALARLQFPMPSIDTQRRIIMQIRTLRARLDAAIADAREAIVLSKERRAALVSAAVTGEIKVSDKNRVLV